MRARSFRWRLALFSALVTGVILLIFGGAAWAFVSKSLLDGVDSRLKGPCERMARRGHEGREPRRFRDALRFVQREFEQETLILVMSNVSGEQQLLTEENAGGTPWGKNLEVLKSQLPPEDALEVAREEAKARAEAQAKAEAEALSEGEELEPPPEEGDPERERGRNRPPRGPLMNLIGEPRFFTMIGDDGRRWRTAAASNVNTTFFVSVDQALFDADMKRLRGYFLVAIPLGLLAIAFGSWLISRRAIRPLERIISTASGMSAEGLDGRIPVTGKESAEFLNLVNELNRMMERLEASFHQASRFTADASHELKTPIAIMQAEIELALKDCAPESTEEAALMNLQEENRRLSRITQSLLLLSQADSGRLKLSLEEVDLSQEVEALAEDAELLCAKEGLEFNNEVENGIKVQADRVLLGQAMQNLLSNAIKYNREDGRVSCVLVKEEGEAVLTLFNTGEPIPEEEQGKIFDRFFRVDKARGRDVEGFGLGLNLSLEIVRAHGGSLSLAGSDGDGTRMELRLPIA